MYSSAYPSRSSDYHNTEMRDLDFSDDENPLSADKLKRDHPANLAIPAEPGVAVLHGQEPGADEPRPETLFERDGASSRSQSDDGLSGDQHFILIDEDETGGCQGLDETEWASIDPLARKPWNTSRP